MEHQNFNREEAIEANKEQYRQELLFECDRLAIVSLATAIDSQVHKEANQEIEEIREAWYDDTWETLF